MNSDRKFQRSIRTISILFIIVAILIIVYVSKLALVGSLKFGDMDFLAFVGSILGGLMAVLASMFAIYYSTTIVIKQSEKQDREKFLELYPHKIKRFDDKIDELEIFKSELNFKTLISPSNIGHLIARGFKLIEGVEYLNGYIYHNVQELGEEIYNVLTRIKQEEFYVIHELYREYKNLIPDKEQEVESLEMQIKDRINKSIELVNEHKLKLQVKFMDYTQHDE